MYKIFFSDYIISNEVSMDFFTILEVKKVQFYLHGNEDFFSFCLNQASYTLAFKPAKQNNKIQSPPLPVHYCIPPSVAKTFHLRINPRNHVNSLPTKKFRSTEFGTMMSE